MGYEDNINMRVQNLRYGERTSWGLCPVALAVLGKYLKRLFNVGIEFHIAKQYVKCTENTACHSLPVCELVRPSSDRAE
jgi:hypothetical protein